MGTEIERIYRWTKCQCLKPSARLINIQAICNGKEPPHEGYEGSMTCDVHGPGSEDTDG